MFGAFALEINPARVEAVEHFDTVRDAARGSALPLETRSPLIPWDWVDLNLPFQESG
jgi:hypothetical protein